MLHSGDHDGGTRQVYSCSLLPYLSASVITKWGNFMTPMYSIILALHPQHIPRVSLKRLGYLHINQNCGCISPAVHCHGGTEIMTGTWTLNMTTTCAAVFEMTTPKHCMVPCSRFDFARLFIKPLCLLADIELDTSIMT